MLKETIPQLPCVLNPNDTLRVRIRYEGVESGTDSCIAVLQIKEPCQYTASAHITGETSSHSAKATITIKSDSAYAGEIVSLPLKVESTTSLIQSGVTGYEAKIRFNKTILVPAGNTPKGATSGDWRTIDLSGQLSDNTDVLSNLTYVAALGNVACTQIFIDEFAWLGAPVTTDLEAGTFC